MFSLVTYFERLLENIQPPPHRIQAAQELPSLVRNYVKENKELLLYHIQTDSLDMTQSLGVLFRDLLNAIYSQYDHLLWTNKSATPNIPDPMLNHNVSWNWSRSHFETFMRRINEARSWADTALKTDDRETAIAYWQEIFGEEFFPSEIETAASRLASAGFPGKSYVTSTGLILPSQPTSGIYTATQATKFHGTEQI